MLGKGVTWSRGRAAILAPGGHCGPSGRRAGQWRGQGRSLEEEQPPLASVCCSGGFAFPDLVTCPGAGKTGELDPSRPSGDSCTWGSQQGDLRSQTAQGSLGGGGCRPAVALSLGVSARSDQPPRHLFTRGETEAPRASATPGPRRPGSTATGPFLHSTVPAGRREPQLAPTPPLCCVLHVHGRFSLSFLSQCSQFTALS